jgi:chloride channel protein, CIC family
VSDRHEPQVLFADETLDQALRQLVLYGRSGLPVVSADREHLRGWVTRQSVLQALADRVASSESEAEEGRLASEFSEDNAATRLHVPRTPLDGYDLVEIAIGGQSAALDRHVGEIDWPPGAIVVAVSEGREMVPARHDLTLHLGERIVLLVPNHGGTAVDADYAADEPDR